VTSLDFRRNSGQNSQQRSPDYQFLFAWLTKMNKDILGMQMPGSSGETKPKLSGQ